MNANTVVNTGCIISVGSIVDYDVVMGHQEDVVKPAVKLTDMMIQIWFCLRRSEWERIKNSSSSGNSD